MKTFTQVLTLAGVLAIVASLAVSWNGRRQLRSVEHELQVVTGANEFLKKTLGDMTVAIASKEKEISRLQNSSCDAQPKPHAAAGTTGPVD
jgi:hypothetical protein